MSKNANIFSEDFERPKSAARKSTLFNPSTTTGYAARAPENPAPGDDADGDDPDSPRSPADPRSPRSDPRSPKPEKKPEQGADGPDAPEPSMSSEAPEARPRTSKEIKRLVRATVGGLIVLGLYGISIFYAYEAREIQKEVDAWSKARCSMASYGADCVECAMTVTIMSNVDGSIVTVPWDASEAMEYSYVYEAVILPGEMFECCNLMPPSCCNFFYNEEKQFCDMLGPASRNELTGKQCPMGPWPCRYQVITPENADGEVDEKAPVRVDLKVGYDTRADDLWSWVSIFLSLAVLGMLCHPLFWKVVGDLCNKIAQMLVDKYFQSVTMAKVKQKQEEYDEEQRLKNLHAPKEDPGEGLPWNHPLVAKLDYFHKDAAALRWKCTDPIMVGTVSAHTLKEADLSSAFGNSLMLTKSSERWYDRGGVGRV
jgi:hypothetical protein